MSKAKLPVRVRGLVYAVVLGAGCVLLVRTPEAVSWSSVELYQCLALALAIAVTEQFSIQLKFRTENWNFTLTDALWAGGLLLVRPSVLAFAVALGIAAGQLFRRWAPIKVAFNVGQFLLGITVAQLVVQALHGPVGVVDANALVAGGLGMAVFFITNVTLLAMVISLMESKSLATVLRPSFGLNVVHWGGNTAIGMLGALVWTHARIGMPLLIVPLALSYFAYRAWVQSMLERDRMRDLYEAGQVLFGPLSAGLEFTSFLELIQRMLGVDAADLVLVENDRVTLYGPEGSTALSVLSSSNGERAAPDAYVRVRPGLSSHVAVIGEGAEVRGVVAVYRDGPLSSSERSLLDALAAQVFVKLENRRLFTEASNQRTQLAEIISNTTDGIFVVSPAGRISTWNPAMERITGFPSRAAVGRPLEQLLGATPAEVGVGAAVRGARDLPIVREDGAQRWIRTTANPIPGRDGGLKAEVVVARDVTADLEAEQLKADFVATVSHELRTPLTPLKGFLTSLIKGTVEDSPEARAEYYRIMANQADRLERLINDLLEASRIESGKSLVESRSLDLAAVLGAQVAEFASAHPDRSIILSPTLPVMVSADPLRLEQVASNLISNACKYSPAGSTVTVSISRTPSHAIVNVRDEGEGIPLSEQDKVFERFHRVENGLTRRTGGAGLGLYIAKRLVEAMSGRVWVVSRPGVGSTFSFSLPLEEAEDHAASGPTPASLATV